MKVHIGGYDISYASLDANSRDALIRFLRNPVGQTGVLPLAYHDFSALFVIPIDRVVTVRVLSEGGNDYNVLREIYETVATRSQFYAPQHRVASGVCAARTLRSAMGV